MKDWIFLFAIWALDGIAILCTLSLERVDRIRWGSAAIAVLIWTAFGIAAVGLLLGCDHRIPDGSIPLWHGQ